MANGKTFENILNRVFKRESLRRLNAEARELPTPELHREKSLTEKKATFLPYGTGHLFCVHGKSYFEPCHATTCRRTKLEAKLRFDTFVKGLEWK